MCDGGQVGGTLGGDEEALRAFEQHLRIERGRSEHTTRAYLSDLRALRAYLTKDPPGDGYAPLLAADLGDLAVGLAIACACRHAAFRHSGACPVSPSASGSGSEASMPNWSP